MSGYIDPQSSKALARAHNEAEWGCRVCRIIFHVVVWSALLALFVWAVMS